jgi:hypothetical protein
MPMDSKQLEERIRTDNPRWVELIKKAGIERQ